MKLGTITVPNFHKGNTHSPYDGFDFGSTSLEPASPIATNRQQSPFLLARRKYCLKPPQLPGDAGSPQCVVLEVLIS